MRLSSTLYFAAGAALLLGCGVTDDLGGDQLSPAVGALTLAQHQAICDADARVQAGVTSRDVCVGANMFFRETFEGNGRTCASCHRVERNFTIDAAFIATLPANDPLFVAERNPTLANLERPAQMRARGQIGRAHV